MPSPEPGGGHEAAGISRSFGGAAATWPVVARAQQAGVPTIGFLNSQSLDEVTAIYLRGFRQGLKDTGYIESENITIEYRWAENQTDRPQVLAADLVRRRVAVIAACGGPAAVLAAQAATTTIPVVFVAADDPVRLGYVTSLARPGGNLTGTNFLAAEVGAKRLELLRELVPKVTRVAVLIDPANAAINESTLRDVNSSARAMGLQIHVIRVSNSQEISAAFASFVRERPDALFVAPSPFFAARRVQFALLAAVHKIPAVYPTRNFVDVGGLISYGADLTDAYRQMGVYTGRILKGAKPADLPVVQSTKFELVINVETARILGLTVPHSLLSRADEVIE